MQPSSTLAGLRSPGSDIRAPSCSNFAAREFGGAERDRTADLVNAIHALSQLSYGPAEIPSTAKDP